MDKRNKGLTLAELILALGLFVLVSGIVGKYIVDTFRDNATIANKVMLQTTVSALMNDLERNIVEADIPVLTETSDNEVSAELAKTIEIRKPGGAISRFSFEPDEKVVTYNEIDNEDNIVSTVTFANIVKFYAEKVGNNGLIVEVRAEATRASYELKNTYYTRNTISSSEV